MGWSAWAIGVLDGIGAPVDSANTETLWAWSLAESGADVMRWNNPLNTTQPWASPPSHPMNSVGVQAYMDEASGIAATVTTLLNGYYPVIVEHLRHSVPRSRWQDACPNLGTWGTGCGWLSVTYTGAPGVLEADMTPDQEKKIDTLTSYAKSIYEFLHQGTDIEGGANRVSWLKAALAGSPAGPSEPAEPAEPAEPKTISGTFTGTVA